MDKLESIAVSDLVLAVWKLTRDADWRKNGLDRALWIAGRHYVDRAGSVDLPKPIVDRAKELLGAESQDVANGQTIVEG